MKTLNKVLQVVRNWVELYIPIASFLLMFITFVLQIFCRYLLRSPLQWAYEVTVTCYLWLVVLGACYAQREHAHVVFTLIYDKLSVKGKAFTALLGNLLIFVAFVWSVVPSVRFIEFMQRQQTSILKIGLNIVYAPYIPFLLMMILYAGMEIVKDGRVLFGVADKSEVEAMLAANRTEAEEAILEARKGADQ